MSTSQPTQTLLSVAHTPFRQVSFGVTYQWLVRREAAVDALTSEVNVLAFRYNATDWQLNLFAAAALGAVQVNGRCSGAGLVSVEADAESRRWYVLGLARYLRSVNGLSDVQAVGRVGLAPVLAEFDQLNPWVVLQYQFQPGFERQHVLTPMVRLLYQGFLLEVGVSLRGELWVSFAAEL